MALTRDEVCARIDGMHLDELDLLVVRDGSGFCVEDHRGGPPASDIGSSFEVPDSADEHGRNAFHAGPWTAYQYHGSYVAPRRDNYLPLLDDLEQGRIRALIVGCAPLEDTWVFATRAQN